MDAKHEGWEAEPLKPVQGAFDAQLSFDAPFVEAPAPIQSILKRDGREVPFESPKIAQAILRAAHEVGDENEARAEHLAAAVTIYLANTLSGCVPTVDDVHDAVEKVLIEMGHASIALSYVRYRDRRARIRKLREGDISGFLSEFEVARRERVEDQGWGVTGPAM